MQNQTIRIIFRKRSRIRGCRLLGFKNDGQAKGETFRIWKSVVEKLCPVRALFDYTLKIGPLQNVIFPVSSECISTILKTVIRDAGMDTSVITARCFRSGGATYGIERGVQPDQLMKVGKWKSVNVFYKHYVAAKTARDTTDRMLGISSEISSEISPIKKSLMW